LSHRRFMIANPYYGVLQLFFDCVYGDISGQVILNVSGNTQ
jgi:hypothetical protein